MSARRLAIPLALAALAAGCVDNTAPGNDREAQLEPPAKAADVVPAAEATANVETGLLYPEIMTDPDRGNLPAMGERCLFRYTRVGLPVFAYGATTGVVKLNGKLVPLPSTGEGRYAEGAITVTVRPLEEQEAGVFPAELVLRVADAPNELGFHGFAECGVR